MVVAPVALGRVGAAVGRGLAPSLETSDVAAALVLGPALAAAGAGASAAAFVPGRAVLGPQLAAGPVGAFVAATAGLLVPSFACGVVVLPSLLALCVSLTGAGMGGAPAGTALAGAVVAAFAVGGLVSESVLAAARGSRGPVLCVAGGIGVWVIGGAALGDVVLGPLAPTAGALQGADPWWAALLRRRRPGRWHSLAGRHSSSFALAATRGRARRRRARVPRGRLAIPVAVANLGLRRPDVCLATVAGIGFGGAGVALATTAAAPAPTPLLLGTTSALFASILCPLVICGLLLEGRWLWLGGTPGGRAVGRAGGLVGLAGAAAPVAVVGAAAMSVSGGDRRVPALSSCWSCSARLRHSSRAVSSPGRVTASVLR